MRDDIEAELKRIPDVDDWPGLSAQERERRETVLAGIRRRVAENGPRRAAEGPERGRLFMPFSALKGYEELVGQKEDEAAEED